MLDWRLSMGSPACSHVGWPGEAELGSLGAREMELQHPGDLSQLRLLWSWSMGSLVRHGKVWGWNFVKDAASLPVQFECMGDEHDCKNRGQDRMTRRIYLFLLTWGRFLCWFCFACLFWFQYESASSQYLGSQCLGDVNNICLIFHSLSTLLETTWMCNIILIFWGYSKISYGFFLYIAPSIEQDS